MPEEPLVRPTLRALAAPRRLLPILALSTTLVLAQRAYSREPRAALVGVSLCLAFVLVAPLAFRVLFPEGLELRHGAIRVLIYAGLSVFVVHLVGIDVPSWFGVGPTFLTARTSVPIDVALFMVGGWGLGRDIGLEASLARARAHAAALRRDAEHAQLLALRAQLDPHFLFNTLNALAEWCRTDGETAERAVLELAAVLRGILGGVTTPAWRLADELAVARSVLELHLLRDPALFRVESTATAETDDVPVAPLLLLPLVENAIKHGPARGHRGTIRLVASRRGDRLRVAVENPGAYRGPRAGSHGVPTLERRLALAYDGAASVSLRAEGDGTTATLDLPAAGPTVSA